MAISDEVRREGLAALSVAAVMLLEDAVDGLTAMPTDAQAGRARAKSLASLGADLSALGAAVAVLARHGTDDA